MNAMTAKKLTKAAVNFLCGFIPSKRARHSIRNAFFEKETLHEKSLLEPGRHEIVKRGVGITVAIDEEDRKFWTSYANNLWENSTLDIFDEFIDLHSDYLDIGAWIGPTALYGACKSRNAYAFEPDKLAFEKLKINKELNLQLEKKLHIFNYGIGKCTQKVKFYVGEGATSTSSVLSNKYNKDNFYYVDFIDIKTAIEQNNIEKEKISFIKIDIEGGEYEVLPSIISYFEETRQCPAILVSTHAPFIIGDESDPAAKEKLFRELNAGLLATLNYYPYLFIGQSRIQTIDDIGSKPRFFDILATKHENRTTSCPTIPSRMQ